MTRYYKYKKYPDFYIFRDMCSRTGHTLGFALFRVSDKKQIHYFNSLGSAKFYLACIYVLFDDFSCFDDNLPFFVEDYMLPDFLYLDDVPF